MCYVGSRLCGLVSVEVMVLSQTIRSELATERGNGLVSWAPHYLLHIDRALTGCAVMVLENGSLNVVQPASFANKEIDLVVL